MSRLFGYRPARKQDFLLLDFFGVCEYFESEFNYDEKLTLPRIGGRQRPPNEDPQIDTPLPPSGAVDAHAPDAIKSTAMIQIGAEGMRIDRELYPKPHQQFEYVVQHSEEIKRVQETEGVEAVEEFVK